MPNLTARDMLARIPVRMAEGGTVDNAPGVSAAYRKAMQAGGQQTVDDYYANLRKDAAAYLANPNAPTGVDAYNLLLESGISTSDLRAAGVADEVLNKIFTVSAPIAQSQFVTPTGMTSAYERSPDLAYESQRLTALGQDGRGILDKQGRDYVANLQQGGIDAAERAQMLEYATERGYSFDDLLKAGVDPNVLFTQRAAPAFPDPVPYTPVTVYQPLPAQPDIYKAGQPALDTAFRESAPRTAIPGMPGQFDYTPAAKLRPATGAGYTWTPPSVTTRPRSLLSPREIQAYGGTGLSKSQQFAQNRSLIDRNLRDMLGATPALRDTSTYNLLRNQVMSGRFGADPARVFNPETAEGKQFQAYLASLAGGAAPAQAAATGTTTGTVTDAVIEGDATDRQIAAGGGTTVAGGYAAPISASPLTYGGYRFDEFSKGGAVNKNNGVARFAEGGAVSAADLLRQLEGIDNTPSARTPEPEPEIEQTESRSMLDRLKGAGSAVNRAFYENISKPAVGAAVDMTVGLGDLAQMGARYLGDRAGMDTGEFTPAAPRVREALGVEGYDPYAIGSIATQILPFAAAGRTAASAPTVARQFDTMFPNIGRESGAYVGGESAASIAREVAPESTAAELLAGVAGGMGGASAMNVPAMSRMDAPTGDEPPAGSAASMLDELDQATTPDVRLSRAELGRVNASVGSNRNKQRLMKEEARRIKGNFLPTNGWEAIEFSGVKKGKPEFQKIAYGFQKPPPGMEKEAWANSLSDNLVKEVDGVVERARSGDQAALGILQQANWYRGMRDQLRSEFGGIGDVFADVLGTTSAQTNVEQNFNNASEILRRYSRGEFDAELQAYENRIKQGLPVDGKTLTAMHNAGEFPLITNSAGKLFNTNSPSSMGALLDMFRSVKTGSAPKTPNFTGNLIGLTNEATVDVWAARMLRRLSGQSRIPPVAEQGVTGTHLVGSSLGNPRVGGEFGFGQEVFRNAANRINQSGNVKDVVPEMGDLGPDDLQAVAWFMEKERWTNNGWTTKAGEGGSLEYEMSLAGSPEQVRIDDLRREINAGFKAPNKRKKETDAEYAERVAQARRVYDNKQELAGIELQSLSAPLQRYTLGVSGERPELPMSNYAQAELAAEFDDVVRNDKSVLGYNLANTYGSFMGNTERSLNGEFVVQQDFDPTQLTRRLIEQGKNYNQDAVFISKAVRSGTPNARPGVEIFFKKPATPERLAEITAILRERGIDGFTYITDMRFDDRVNRQARSGAPETASLTGLRFQYVPEFDENFDPARANEIYKEKERLFRGVLNDTMADENVSDARVNYYDTQVFFRDGYDEYLTRTAPRGNSRAGRELPSSPSNSQPNNGGGAREELSKLVSDGIGQAARASPQKGINSPSKTSRPVNEQLGIDRAKSIVEESGYRWNDVKQIATPEEYLQFQRRYGLASAVSERDDPTDVFHKGGAMFYDDATGKPVAYAPSGSQRKKPEGINNSAVTSSRQMLDNLIVKKPEGQRVDATGLQGFAQGLESPAGSAADDLAALTGKAQTDTPEFKKWFGDSKVVDADGKPLVLYHGTPLVGTTRAFTTFQESDAPGWGRGIYMTDNKQQAGEEFGGERDKVMPVYASIKNPYTEGPINIESTKAWKDYVKKQGKRTEEDPDYNEETDYIDSYDVIEENAYVLNDALRELGYDGIIAKNSNNIDGLEVVVFSPTQIKSATDNVGTFDPSTPVITKAKGGTVTSSRRMLDGLYGTNAKGQRFANGGEARVGGSAPAVAGRTGMAAQLAAQRAADPQTESRTMLERLGRFASLDTPQDMGLGETVADIGMGFLPVVGTAQGARDFERARRDEDKLGMLLSAASMIPVAGGAVRAARSAGKAADVVEEVPGAARQMLDEVVPPAAQLDMSEAARIQRAAEQGFDVSKPLYHGTDKNFDEFITRKGLSGKASYFTPDPDVASAYAMGDVRFKKRGPGATVMPVYVRGNILDLENLTRKQEIDIWKEIENYELRTAKPGTLKYEMLTDNKFPTVSQSLSEITDEEYIPDYAQMMEKLAEINMTNKILEKLGYAGVKGREVLLNPRGTIGDKEYESIAIFDPSNIRSVNAAFDPSELASPVITKAKGGLATKSNVERVRNDNRRYL